MSEPTPPPAALGAPATIRVVDARRAQTDLLALAPAEAASVLGPLAAAAGRGPEGRSLLALEHLAARLRELRDRGPAEGGEGGEGEVAEVALRQLLYSPEAVPIVQWPPGRPGDGGGLRVRPGKRIRAFAESGDRVAVAAEQPVAVVGLVLDPSRQGGRLLEAYGQPRPPAFGVLAATGGYSAPVASVALGRQDPAASPLAPPPPSFAPYPGGLGGYAYSPALVAAFRRQLSWAADFHLSGAGGELAVEAATAGRAAPPPAPPAPPSGTESGGLEGWGGGLIHGRARHFVAALARVFPQVSAGPAEFVYQSSALADIARVGGWSAFRATVLEGREAPSAAAFLASAAHAQAADRQLAALVREDQAATAKARQLLLVVEDRLGAPRAAALSAAGAAVEPEKVLAALAPKERRLVELEYEGRRAAWEAEVGNKCPHVGLAHRLRRAVSSREGLRLLRELETYFAPPPRGEAAPDWHHCSQCGFRALCPHVREMVRMEAEALPYDTVRARLHKYAVRYSDRGGDGRDERTTYSYFCRICGEQMADFVQEDRTAERLGAVGSLEPGLRGLLYAEALALAPSVRFPVAATDPRAFASAAADVCHPLLLAAEAAVARRGAPRPSPAARPSPHDPFGEEAPPPPRTRLAAIVFVHGYLLHLIQSTAGRPATAVGYEGVRPGAKMAEYARAALEALARRHRALLAQLEDVTELYVADRLREAYRLVAAGGAAVVTAADEAGFLVQELTHLDPVYRYAAVAARVFGALPPGRPDTPEAARREFESALGRRLPARLFGDRGKKATKAGRPPDLPVLAQMLLGIRPGRSARRLSVEYPPGVPLRLLYGDPDVNLYAEVFAPPPGPDKGEAALAAMAAFAEKFPACGPAAAREVVVGGRPPRAAARPPPRKPPGGGLSTPPPRSPFGEELSAAAGAAYRRAYRLFVAYAADSYTREKREAFEAALAEAHLRERGLALRKAQAAAPNFRAFPFTRLRRFGQWGGGRPEVGITFLYDEEGLPHSWANLGKDARFRAPPSRYVYEAADGETSELARGEVVAEVAAARAAGGPSPLEGKRLVDVRCSVCGVRLSGVGELSAAKARASLRANQEFDAFFAFYGVRCPRGGVHAFAGGRGGACARCGLPQALVFGYGEAGQVGPARAYYERYLAQFHAERGDATSAAQYLEAAGPARPAPPPAEAAGEGASAESRRAFAEAWRPDFGVVRRGAAAAEVPVAALEALGATERRDYADVLSGAGAPPPPARADDPRLAAADAAVRLFTSAYNRTRFVARFRAVPAELRGLFEAAGVPPHEYPSLPRRLPEVFEDYREKRAAVLRYRPPPDALAFSIEALARMAAQVAAAGPEPPWLAALARGLVRQAVGEVVESERLLAKPGPFNFKIFGADPDADIDPLGTAEVDDVAGVAGEDVVVPGDGEGGGDPFSLAGVDIAPEDRGNLDAQ